MSQNDDRSSRPAQVQSPCDPEMGSHEAKLAASYERKSLSDPQGILDQYRINAGTAERERRIIPDDPAFRFSDDDVSGAADRRPAFDRLVKVIESGNAPFETLYVKDRSRFGRWTDPSMHPFYEKLFERNGVTVRYCNEDPPPAAGQRDRDAVTRYLMGAVKNITASEERKNLIERIRGGLRSRALDGFYPGSQAPYGTTRWHARLSTGALIEAADPEDRLRREGCGFKLRVADDQTPRIVIEIFERYVAGEACAAIARDLNARAIRSPRAERRRSTEDDIQWSSTGIKNILANRIYCGDLIWGAEGDPRTPVPAEKATRDGTEPFIYAGFLPDAPVTTELFTLAQSRLLQSRETARGRRAASPSYLLSSLVHCVECGRPLHGHTSTKAWRNRRRYYRHEVGRTERSRGCSQINRYVRAETLESVLLETLQHVFKDDRLQQLVESEIARRLGADGAGDRERDVARITEGLSRKKKALDQINYDIAVAASDEDRQSRIRVQKRLLREVEVDLAEITRLESEIATLHLARSRREQSLSAAADLWPAFASSDIDEQQRAVRLVIDRIDLCLSDHVVDVHVKAI